MAKPPSLPTDSAPVTLNECSGLLKRIGRSPQFHSCPKLRKLLLYIVTHGLNGDLDALKESAIGHALYNRPITYSTGEDNVVRMGVSQLRRKLQKFFDEEGDPGALRIEIPKGCYVPTFTRQGVPAPLNCWIRVWRQLDFRSAKWRLPAVVLSGLAILITAFLIMHDRKEAAIQDVNAALGRFWQEVVGDGRLAMIVSEDVGYLVASEASKNGQPNLSDLEKYAEENNATRKRGAIQPTTQLSLRICARLMASQPARFNRVSFTSSRDVRLQDFDRKSVILVGSPRACPWTALFENSLNFQFHYDPVSNRSEFRNRQPRRGESQAYMASESSDPGGKVYSLISVLPNLGHTGKVLILMGTRTEGTEAAADAVSAPGKLARILKFIGHCSPAPLPYFEVLLESDLKDGASLEPRIVAARVYQNGDEPRVERAALAFRQACPSAQGCP